MMTKRILIVEDDAGILAVTKFSLEMEGHWQVTTAVCAREGVAKAKALRPDVILLDVILPDSNGFEPVEKMQSDRTTSRIPIILFTAKAIDNTILELYQDNVVGIINKPFDCLNISARILALLNGQSKRYTIS